MTRTRIGLIIPATNSTAEPDFNMAVPKKVTVHAQRMWNTNELTPETTESMNQGAQEAARYLGQAKIDLLVYACTTGSFFEGPAYDEDLLKRLGKEAGAPAISTSGMAAEALEFLGAKRISVASPYFPWMNRGLAKLLRGQRLSGPERGGRSQGSSQPRTGILRYKPGGGAGVRFQGLLAGGGCPVLRGYRLPFAGSGGGTGATTWQASGQRQSGQHLGRLETPGHPQS